VLTSDSEEGEKSIRIAKRGGRSYPREKEGKGRTILANSRREVPFLSPRREKKGQKTIRNAHVGNAGHASVLEGEKGRKRGRGSSTVSDLRPTAALAKASHGIPPRSWKGKRGRKSRSWKIEKGECRFVAGVS